MSNPSPNHNPFLLFRLTTEMPMNDGYETKINFSQHSHKKAKFKAQNWKHKKR